MNARVDFNRREMTVWGETVDALRRFRAEQSRQDALSRFRAAILEADRRHTPEEIAAAERALGV